MSDSEIAVGAGQEADEAPPPTLPRLDQWFQKQLAEAESVLARFAASFEQDAVHTLEWADGCFTAAAWKRVATEILSAREAGNATLATLRAYALRQVRTGGSRQ